MPKTKLGPRILLDADWQFNPQWADRRVDLEMCDLSEEEISDQCRLCACTDYSPCEVGCGWAEADLCSACVELMAVYPMLRIADGHGIIAGELGTLTPGKELLDAHQANG